MTPEQQAAMRQMIEALNEVTGWQWAGPMRVMDEVEDAIRAGKAALEQQPAGEPVAWMHEWADGERIPLLHKRDQRKADKPVSVRPLIYGDTRPQPAAQWVGLTDDEIHEIYDQVAKLREKNY